MLRSTGNQHCWSLETKITTKETNLTNLSLGCCHANRQWVHIGYEAVLVRKAKAINVSLAAEDNVVKIASVPAANASGKGVLAFRHDQDGRTTVFVQDE
jgi:hypothetical protein